MSTDRLLPGAVRLIDCDGQLDLRNDFLCPGERDKLFLCLLEEIDWQQEHIRLFGRTVKVPRLVRWYGDPNARYRYSGVRHEPHPWSPTLEQLRGRLQHLTGLRFNSVLANLYRNGSDSMGWHADNEKELGTEPSIASLSLGAERIFRIRHKASGQMLELLLLNGSLLVMSGPLQKHWRHHVPKTQGLSAARINLTFRYVHPELSGSEHERGRGDTPLTR